ncbi:Metallo-dependent phosphatase-like protein [Hyaloraphidium curvatum]|nr:Metallo-dependent phosphatase-like protein [Hyaloraphidium curvatum]
MRSPLSRTAIQDTGSIQHRAEASPAILNQCISQQWHRFHLRFRCFADEVIKLRLCTPRGLHAPRISLSMDDKEAAAAEAASPMLPKSRHAQSRGVGRRALLAAAASAALVAALAVLAWALGRVRTPGEKTAVWNGTESWPAAELPSSAGAVPTRTAPASPSPSSGSDPPVPSATPESRPTLRFPPSGKLKIAILADLHLGEAPDTAWGPEQDKNTTRVLRAVLAAERPDFAVLSGDQVTGEFMSSNETAKVGAVLGLLQEARVPWASVHGNHDKGAAAGFAESLLAVEQGYPLSLTQRGPKDVAGLTNYRWPVLGTDGLPRAVLWFLDSGTQGIERDQVDWLRREHAALSSSEKAAKHLLFVHIPLRRFRELQSSPLFLPPSPGRPPACAGLTDEPKMAVQKADRGLMPLLSSLKFTAVYSGHDHGTTWCCRDPGGGVVLCMGRHTGYGGYGEWDRGARMVQLDEGAMGADGWMPETWVRMEDGRVLRQ